MIYRNRFPNVISRSEIKLRLKPAEAETLLGEVQRYLPQYCYVADRPATFVSSVYFDTENFEFYRRAKRFPHDNLKVRLKEYYYQLHGTYDVSPYCWVELKRRLSEATSKFRFQVPKKIVNRLFEGEDLFPVVLRCNPTLCEEDVRTVYGDFFSVVRRYRLKAHSVTNYRRRTFQRPEDESVRVTFDDMIAYFRPPPLLFNGTSALIRERLGVAAGRQYHTVVEIKVARHAPPQWLRELLRRYPQSNFSKFLTSTQCILPLLEREVRKRHLTQPEEGPPRGPGEERSSEGGTSFRIS